MVFSGRGLDKSLTGVRDNSASDPKFQSLIQQSTMAFWDAYLKSDETAQKWLRDGACKTMLGQDATLEVKPAKGH